MFCVAFSRDGKYLIGSTAEDGKLLVWDAQTHVLQQVVQAHTHDISSVTFSSDNTLVAGSDGKYGQYGIHMEFQYQVMIWALLPLRHGLVEVLNSL